ncbi:MAG: sigma-24, subfamily [Candidatus Angelobacter sp.]|jgi:RNA polymerase sigma factor (sigma-70 family)|nr:sigma-24, subfamily [Candidatus Angelobacter sp.]
MNLHFSYKAAKSPDIEKEIQQHIGKLEPRLKAFSPDLVHLHGTLDSAPQNGLTVGLNLRLPTGQLFAQAEGSGGEAAVKAAFAELTSQLNRHKDLLRNGHKWVRDKGIAAEALSPIPQVPRTRAQSDDGIDSVLPPHGNGEATQEEISAASFELENRDSVQSDVRKYLTAKLPRLERFVARELVYREANGQITPRSISREEVIDEVATAALSVEKRPSNISLEKWIYRLCIHAIRMLASGNSIDLSNVSLEQPVVTPNVTASDESFLQYHQPGEILRREDMISDPGRATPEQIAASDEYIDQLEQALRGAKPDEREAFVLFAIEGFTVEEIAQINVHSVEQVRQSINGAREHLMKKLPDNNSLKKKLLQYSSVA